MKRMTGRMVAVLGVALSGASAVWAAAGSTQWSKPTDVPTPKVNEDGTANREFGEKHRQFCEQAKAGNVDLLFLGDSITADWTWGNHPQLFQKYFGQYRTANFGIGGDRTEHVLWRIENGELEGIHPKVIVLLIGTNNIGWSAGDITRGIEKIVSVIHEKLPETKVLLLGIFPRQDGSDAGRIAEMAGKIRQVNENLAKLDDGRRTRFLDIGQKFVSSDGTIAKDVMPDGLHPESKGLEIWGDAMGPVLERMIGKSNGAAKSG